MKNLLFFFVFINIFINAENLNKIKVIYNVSLETLTGYQEYEENNLYSNISKCQGILCDNYLGLIQKNKIEKLEIPKNGFKLLIFEDGKGILMESKRDEILKFKLSKNEKKIFDIKLIESLIELKENYTPQGIGLFDRVTEFSMERMVEIIETEDYSYMTFIPGKYNKNNMSSKNFKNDEIEYIKTKELIKFLKDLILKYE